MTIEDTLKECVNIFGDNFVHPASEAQLDTIEFESQLKRLINKYADDENALMYDADKHLKCKT